MTSAVLAVGSDSSIRLQRRKTKMRPMSKATPIPGMIKYEEGQVFYYTSDNTWVNVARRMSVNIEALEAALEKRFEEKENFIFYPEWKKGMMEALDIAKELAEDTNGTGE